MNALLILEPRVAGEEEVEFDDEFTETPDELHMRCTMVSTTVTITRVCTDNTKLC